jgi:hypothetical protein
MASHNFGFGFQQAFYFGWSKYSQLGLGDFQDHLIPHQVKALEKTKVQYVSTFPDVLPYLSPESQNFEGFFCAKKF